MKNAATVAQHKTDSIVKEFKRVDESLKHSASAIDSANKKLLDALTSKPDKIK
ncbi:hypothetical protein GCM10027043_02530 [Ferruginibacter profundus]